MTFAKLSLAVSSLALVALGACTKGAPSHWSRDCQKHFSVTGRELSQCQQKVENNDRTTIPAGTISLDPENASRQEFDSIGKGGASDDEDIRP